MYESYPNLETRTKIVATIGPASWDSESLMDLLAAGVDVCRINCSHSDHEGIRRQVSRIRRAAMQLGRPAAILLDLQGPKIRTGKADAPTPLAEGDILTIVMDEELLADGKRIGTTYPELAEDVDVGMEVLFADGALSGHVTAVRDQLDPAEVDITIEVGGELGSHKGINLPGANLSTPSMTDKDRADVQIGVEVRVDYIALSFVRSADDIRELKDVLAELGQPDIPIIAKIEKPQAVEALEAILDEAAGVMVARGDLGVEVQIEKVPVYQKVIIEAARRKAKLCITATQMLDSMERNPRPTRAETTDVANAILDATDAVMLSGETATGKHPVLAVRTMDNIAREVEDSRFFRPTPLSELPNFQDPTGQIVQAACFSVAMRPRPILVFTMSGRTALLVSKARPAAPIYALTHSQAVADQLSLAWGVTPVAMSHVRSAHELLQMAEQTLIEKGHLQPGEEVVVISGQAGLKGTTNQLKIHVVGAED
jgi:pyruvate kinase